MKRAHLVLEDGSVWTGFSFGAEQAASGEVVFNTGMVGYEASLTDPSYCGQILVFSYPLIGNYGVPARRKDAFGILRHFESERIHARGVIVSTHAATPSHYEKASTFDAWLAEEGIPGIAGIDTRSLVQTLREKGTMLGSIVPDGTKRPQSFYNPENKTLALEVSVENPVLYQTPAKTRSRRKKIILIDCGVKHNIIRSLLMRGVDVLRVPWNWDITKERYDGVCISNGPGNPTMLQETVATVRKLLATSTPILGICMGNQILALAAGARTYKLPYGHRSQNQPCRQEGTQRCFITSQNHGYAVREKTLPRGWVPWFQNANDNSNEGIRHTKKPFYAVQFHPEASPGPTDCGWIFDHFLSHI